MSTPFPSEHFTLHTLAEGMYAAIAKEAGAGGSNTGLVDLGLEARYIRTLEDMVQQVVKTGGAVEAVLSQTLPPPFDQWQALGHRFESNVRASYTRLSAKYGKQKNRIT